MNDNDRDLEPAWQKLLEPKQPDHSEFESEFKAFVEWAAETRERLDEPDRTILDLFLQGLTRQQIGDRINRSRGCITGRLRKIIAKGQIRADDFRYFAAILQTSAHAYHVSVSQLLASLARREDDHG